MIHLHPPSVARSSAAVVVIAHLPCFHFHNKTGKTMSSNINISGSVQIGTVNTRVVGWIDRILRDAGMPAPESMQLAIENNTEFELRLLNCECWQDIWL